MPCQVSHDGLRVLAAVPPHVRTCLILDRIRDFGVSVTGARYLVAFLDAVGAGTGGGGVCGMLLGCSASVGRTPRQVLEAQRQACGSHHHLSPESAASRHRAPEYEKVAMTEMA
jgi:hypothetical protein